MIMTELTENERFQLNNEHFTSDEFLYHLALSRNENLQQRFGDVKVWSRCNDKRVAIVLQ